MMKASRKHRGTSVHAARPIVAAGTAGLVAWFAIAARPYAGDAGTDDHLPLFFTVLATFALILGAVWPHSWTYLPAAMVVPQIIAAPFSAPRGDGDGLWIFVFVYLIVMLVVLWLPAWIGSTLGRVATRTLTRAR